MKPAATRLLLECRWIPAYSSMVASCWWVTFQSLVASEGAASGRRRHEFQVHLPGRRDWTVDQNGVKFTPWAHRETGFL